MAVLAANDCLDPATIPPNQALAVGLMLERKFILSAISPLL
jgi:hypothetical protein